MRFILLLAFLTAIIINSDYGAGIDPNGVGRATVNSDRGPLIDPDGGITPDAGPRIDPEG